MGDYPVELEQVVLASPEVPPLNEKNIKYLFKCNDTLLGHILDWPPRNNTFPVFLRIYCIKPVKNQDVIYRQETILSERTNYHSCLVNLA